MNRAKKIEPVTKKSSSAGRLAGLGGKNWVDHFGPPPRMHVAPSGRSEEENREVQELKAQVARIPQIVQPGNHPHVLPAYLGGVNSELECGWSSRAVPDSKHGQQPLEQRGADVSGKLRVRDSAR